jgi:hypothetical protein
VEVPAIRRARWIARVLDDLVRVPGTRIRVGLDPVLGLVPGLGDWLAVAVSLDVIVTAARHGADAPVLGRMLGNLVLDALVGSVPLLGDVFDLGWKANRRNLALLEDLVADPARTRRRSRWIVGGVLGAAFLTVGAGLWLGWTIVGWLLAMV